MVEVGACLLGHVPYDLHVLLPRGSPQLSGPVLAGHLPSSSISRLLLTLHPEDSTGLLTPEPFADSPGLELTAVLDLEAELLSIHLKHISPIMVHRYTQQTQIT